jgi:hypothetical protein
MMTTFECIVRAPVLRIDVGLDGNPAVGYVRLVVEAAAAIGRENKERVREEDARRNAEANSLAVVVCGSVARME